MTPIAFTNEYHFAIFYSFFDFVLSQVLWEGLYAKVRQIRYFNWRSDQRDNIFNCLGDKERQKRKNG